MPDRDTTPESNPPWMMVAVKPAGKRVVIVGSGAVARRRAEQFASRGAHVEVYDPNVTDEVRGELPHCVIYGREITRNDLNGAWLVVVATDQPITNQQVGQWAAELDIDCNRTDEAEAGTFAVPALLEDDAGWKLAVLGGEAGPLFSAWMKGLIGHLATREQVTAVYNALAQARHAVDQLSISARERGFLMRRAMARILESTSSEAANELLDGAEIVRELVRR